MTKNFMYINKNNDSGQTSSVWMQTAHLPVFPALDQDIDTQSCVVGAGIAGLSSAYLLALEGKNVVLVDDNTIGRRPDRPYYRPFGLSFR